MGAELHVSDSCTRRVTLKVYRDSEAGNLMVGEGFTLFSDRWQAPLVEAVASTATAWRRFIFQPTDAVHFLLGTAAGWQEVGGELPTSAVESGVESGGWNHEHCSLCGSYIDVDSPTGYADDNGLFLCAVCYDKYAAHHDVSFVLGA